MMAMQAQADCPQVSDLVMWREGSAQENSGYPPSPHFEAIQLRLPLYVSGAPGATLSLLEPKVSAYK